MKNKLFIILLVAIALLGLGLRLVDYDRLPGFEETQDEFFYPWAGMTMLQRKPPVGWSWFEAYPKREIKTFWGAQYPLVSPWLEKPPLYSLLSGAWMLLSGAKEIWEVRLTVLRLLPIGLSFFTIILTGILATKVFSRPVGIIAALLYATTPTMVMANRMS
ncbi:MAG: Glycosyl transferase family 39, partial [Candidatus Gottesmanbacteria bacterium GW2011_GWC1_43_10]